MSQIKLGVDAYFSFDSHVARETAATLAAQLMQGSQADAIAELETHATIVPRTPAAKPVRLSTT